MTTEQKMQMWDAIQSGDIRTVSTLMHAEASSEVAELETIPCLSCDGEGTKEYMSSRDPVKARYYIADCEECGGTGRKEL